MKKLIIVALLGVSLIGISCKNTDPKHLSYVTLASLEAGTANAYNAYEDSVIKGIVKTNDLPKVAAAWNQFQYAMQIAIALANGNTNSLATSQATEASANLVNILNNQSK